jgi:iron-sulfur cluster assembly protein
MSDCGDVKKVFVPNKETVAEIPVINSGLMITDKAAEKIKLFTQQDQKTPETHGLRIAIVKEGCSGSSYTMDLADIQLSQSNGDKCFHHQGATAIIDKLSYLFITGSILDYTESLLGSGFKLLNPNEKKSCSCGSSVSFK